MNRLIVIYDSFLPDQNPVEPTLIWRLVQDGNWMGPETRGTLEQLAGAQGEASAEIWLTLSTPDVVMVNQEFSAKEKRHLTNLMPYELEDQLLGNVENFHFAYGHIVEDLVTVAYTPIDWLTTLIESIENEGVEITTCLPLFLLLPWEPNQWAIRWLGEESLVEVHYGKDLGFIIELDLLKDALDSLSATLEENHRPKEIKLFGQSFEDLQSLQNNLPESLQEIATSQQWDQWLSLSLDNLPPFNLRQQSLGRSLPVNRWWKQWRPAAIAAGIAAALYLGGNWIQTHQLRQEQNALIAETERTYRTVMPRGALADPELQLRNQLSKFKSNASNSGPGVVSMLSQITPMITAADEVSVRNMNFIEGDMRLNVESPSFQEIDRLRAQLESQKLVAELLGTSSVPNGVQARLRIRSNP
jgi:general secretion pathway protein L